MTIKYIEGNLISLALDGSFDVIAHGCNCFNRMKRGIAPQMAEAFGCDLYDMERYTQPGDINKLGNIDYGTMYLKTDVKLYIVNAYTQYNWSTDTKPFDYEAFTICMRKINLIFKGKHIGLPKIGSHLAGGDWDIIATIIEKELADCKVTVVIFKQD